MRAGHVSPGLHGTSASGAMKGLALLFGAFVVGGFVPLTLLDANWSGAQGGHLPWPALNWAVTTPFGTLLLIVLCILLVGPPYALLTVWHVQGVVAGASDVTGLPPAMWPGPWRTRPRRSSRQRLLGDRFIEQALSLVMLVLGALLAVALAAAFSVSTVYGLSALSRLGGAQCRTHGAGCPPTFPITGIAIAGLFAAIALSYWARARWLRRVEATSHLWLRYREWSSITALYYVRQPGTAPAAAGAALARFSPALSVPLARRFFIGVLAVTPAVVVLSASFLLSAWLQLQWIPG